MFFHGVPRPLTAVVFLFLLARRHEDWPSERRVDEFHTIVRERGALTSLPERRLVLSLVCSPTKAPVFGGAVELAPRRNRQSSPFPVPAPVHLTHMVTVCRKSFLFPG